MVVEQYLSRALLGDCVPRIDADPEHRQQKNSFHGWKMISELSAIRRPFLCVILLLAASQTPNAQRPQDRAPVPAGQDIVAKDGDRIIVEEDAQLQIVRRRSAMVRDDLRSGAALLILLIDYPPKPGEAPDGSVDSMLSYFDVSGDWPLGERWEGLTTVEEYTTAFGPYCNRSGADDARRRGAIDCVRTWESLSLSTRDASVIAVMSYRGSSGAGGRIPAVSFDQAEQEQLAQAASTDRGIRRRRRIFDLVHFERFSGARGNERQPWGWRGNAKNP